MSNGKNTPPPAGAHDKASIASAIDKVNRQVKALRTFDVSVGKDGWDSTMDALQKKVNAILADSLGMGTPEYRQYAVATQDFLLDTTFGDRYTVDERMQRVKHGVDRAIANLNATRKLLTDRLEDRAAAAPKAAPAAEVKPPPLASAPAPAPAPAAPAPALVTAPPPPPPAPAPTPSVPPVTMMPMSKADPDSSSITAQQAVPGARVAVLGWGGDAAGQACEFMEQLGLEAAVLDTVSVDQLEALRNVAFLLLLPGEDPEAPAAMLAIGFMLAVLGRSRIVCLLSDQEALPDALKGATRITVDEGGLWRLLLAREMKRAGLDVDLNRAI